MWRRSWQREWRNEQIKQDRSLCLLIAILFFFFLYFLLFFFNFTILYWFCQISKWIRHRYICVPHPELSSLLPPHTIPLGCPSAPAPSIQYRASNLDWRLVSYMILYMLGRFGRMALKRPKTLNSNTYLSFQSVGLPYRFGVCGPSIMWANFLK